MGDGINRLQEPPFALPFDTIIHGRYRIDKVLGFGGFGITYQGENLNDHTRVAIKEYYPSGMVTRMPGTTAVEVNSSYEQFMKGKDRFLREARIIYHCNNPHILHIFSLFEENNTAYYVMEFLEGEDLRTLIKRQGGRIAWTELKPLCLQIMDALAAVHSEGILHRDISPDNIYVSNGYNAKLIDFGAARSIGSNRSMSVILKKGYAPPEQYQTRGNFGPWTDIYALGGTMFRALTGEMPVESIERVRNDTLRPPSSYGVKLPQEADMAIMRAMNINEGDRFQSVEEFRYAIDHMAAVSNLKKSIPKLIDSFTVWTGEFQSAKEKLFSKAGIASFRACPVVTGLAGIYASQSFTLDKDVIIGRDPNVCSIIFPDGTPGISKVHCQVCINSFGTRIALIDCDSSFGTFVNGIKIPPGTPVPLNEGDVIQVGADNVFRVNL